MRQNVSAEVFELVKKNFKNLIRAKASSLVVILGPIIVIFLAGLAFNNTNSYAVKIGAYRPEVSPLTDSFLEQLHGQFRIVEYDTEERCISAIKSSDVNACMSFSSNFTIGRPPYNEITFFVDYSRINLVWAVMNAMTEKVGERLLQESQNLTRILLETIEFTKERIGEQRGVVVRLTTENDIINRNAADLIAEFGDIDLSFNKDEFGVDNLSNSKQQFKQWLDNVLALGDKGLSKSISFIDAADALVKGSSAGSELKDSLLTNFQKSVDDIKKLQADMVTTKNLTQDSFARFDAVLTQLSGQLGDTQSRLQQADASRQLGLRVLEAVQALLDKSLINIIEVQNAFNEIENKINAIEIRDPEAITQPIQTTIKPIVAESTYLNYLLPVLIVLIVMFTALLIVPTLILLEKHSIASFRMYLTPVNNVSYVLANFVTGMLLLLVQVILILAIASVFLSAQIVTSLPGAVLILLLVSALFTLVGMGVGYLFNTEETATLAGVSVGAIFLFLSDVIIPIESMPDWLASIAEFNPFVVGSSALRRALLFKSSFINLLPEILVLAGYIAAIALIAVGLFMATKKHALDRLTKSFSPVLKYVRRPPKTI
ncbi:MAG TPA: ABC transporter permease [Candidatus Nanoarchaeia archaeon]|nr:ABC transporter permease [Candidatus Nanoarchaeia archaeon]